MTIDQMGGTSAYTVLLSSVLHSRDDLRMVGQTQIVVTTEAEHGSTIHHQLRPLGSRDYPAAAIEMFALASIQFWL
jgi:hypothetical protein